MEAAAVLKNNPVFVSRIIIVVVLTAAAAAAVVVYFESWEDEYCKGVDGIEACNAQEKQEALKAVWCFGVGLDDLFLLVYFLSLSASTHRCSSLFRSISAFIFSTLCSFSPQRPQS